MATLVDALTQANTIIDLKHNTLPALASKLEVLQGKLKVLSDIKADGCISHCVTDFHSLPAYHIPELPVPTGNVVFGTPTRGYTTISQPFTYSGTPSSYFMAKVDGVSIGVVTSPINLTGLTQDTNYVIEVTPKNVYGEGDAASTTVRTLKVAVDAGSGGSGAGAGFTGIITFGTPTITETTITQPFSYSGNDALGFYFKLNNGTVQSVTSPIELDSLLEGTIYNLKVAPYKNSGTGTWYSTNVQTLSLPDTPTGIVTFGVATLGQNTITQPFTYSETDATSFAGYLDGVSIGNVVSPIELTGLTANTEYEITVVPINTEGTGIAASTLETTLESPFTSSQAKLHYDFMYIHNTDDLDLLPTNFHPTVSTSSRMSNNAKFVFKINNIVHSTLNLNNGGGVEDDLNYPSSIVGGVWLGTPFSRHTRVTLTGADILTYAPVITTQTYAYLTLRLEPVKTSITNANVIIRISFTWNDEEVGTPVYYILSPNTDKITGIGSNPNA